MKLLIAALLYALVQVCTWGGVGAGLFSAILADRSGFHHPLVTQWLLVTVILCACSLIFNFAKDYLEAMDVL